MSEWIANCVAALWLVVFLWLTPSFARIVTRKAKPDDLLCALVWLFAINRISFNAIRLWADGQMRIMLGDSWLLLSGSTALASVVVVVLYRRHHR